MSSRRGKSWRSAAAIAWAIAAVSLAACGSDKGPAYGGEGREEPPGDSADPARDLERAERELEASLGVPPGALEESDDATAGQPAPPPPPPAPPPAGAPQQVPGGDTPKPAMRAVDVHDACMIGCRALATMERATSRLCGLATESDVRCLDARSRLSRARRIVRARCPGCAAAS